MSDGLLWAVKNGDLDQVKPLVDKLAKDQINDCSMNGRTALHHAADYGQVDVIEYLIRNGADVNLEDKYGITPLLAAIYESHVKCVKILLENGASKDKKAPGGSSYYDVAETESIKQLLK